MPLVASSDALSRVYHALSAHDNSVKMRLRVAPQQHHAGLKLPGQFRHHRLYQSHLLMPTSPVRHCVCCMQYGLRRDQVFSAVAYNCMHVAGR